MNKKRILIADDDCSVTETLGERLRQNGYDVVIANDGFQALKLLKENKTDLLILDWRMPFKGNSVLETMMKDKDIKNVPVIIYTAAREAGMEKIALKAGVTAIIDKANGSNILMLNIKKILK